MNINIKHIALLTITLVCGACDKYLDITPKGQVIPETTTEYRALLDQAYYSYPSYRPYLTMREPDVTPVDDASKLSGYMAVKNIYVWQDNDDRDGLTESLPYETFYKCLFLINEIIDKAPQAREDKQQTKAQILGEAHALRAYLYFDLANMYGPTYKQENLKTKVVPIYRHIDSEQKFPKATLGDIYQLIDADIKEAQKLISTKQWADTQKYRISTKVLAAIRNRIALYRQQWQETIDTGMSLLAPTDSLADLNKKAPTLPTLYDSKENIWALEINANDNTANFAAIDSNFVKAYDDGDKRKTLYYQKVDLQDGTQPYMHSIKVVGKKNRCSIRRAEILLNTAEAYAHLGNAPAARDLLSRLVRHRYGQETATRIIAEIIKSDAQQLLNCIMKQRRLEFAMEGFTWFDLKRTNRPAISKVLEEKTYKLNENDARYVLQIPLAARKANPLLQEQ